MRWKVQKHKTWYYSCLPNFLVSAFIYRCSYNSHPRGTHTCAHTPANNCTSPDWLTTLKSPTSGLFCAPPQCRGHLQWHLCLSWLRWEYFWHLLGRGRNAAQHPPMQRTAPHSEELSVPKVEKSWSRITINPTWWLGNLGAPIQNFGLKRDWSLALESSNLAFRKLLFAHQSLEAAALGLCFAPAGTPNQRWLQDLNRTALWVPPNITLSRNVAALLPSPTVHDVCPQMEPPNDQGNLYLLCLLRLSLLKPGGIQGKCNPYVSESFTLKSWKYCHDF